MKLHNVNALYTTLAKIFEEKENCKVSVIVKQKEKQKHTLISQN